MSKSASAPTTQVELNAILEHAPIGVLFLRERRLTHVNQQCADIFGYERADLLGQPGVILWATQEDYEQSLTESVPALMAGETYRTERQGRRRDGTIFWCRVSAKAINSARARDGTLWTVEDITERRGMVAEIERSARELTTIFETDLVGIALVSNYKFVRCNRVYELLYDVPEGGLLGRTARVLVDSDDRFQSFVVQAEKAFAEGQPFKGEYAHTRPDGLSRWLRVSGSAISGMSSSSLWLAEDITAERDAEERARRAFEEQQMIFETAAMGILFASRRKVQRCNHKFADIFGYQPEELVGVSTRRFYASEEEYKRLGREAYPVLLAGETYTTETLVPHKGGWMFWVRVTGRPVASSAPGEDVIWIFEDISERRQAEDSLRIAHLELERRVQERTAELQRSEEALRSLNAELEARVAERTAALSATITDLHQTQAELVEAEKLASLGSLVAGVAHELNTPIGNALVTATTLQGRMEMLQEEIAGGKLKRSTLDSFVADGLKMAQLVTRSCDRAAHLVSSFKQIAVDQTSEQRRRFGLADLVDDIVSTLKPSFGHTPWVIAADIPASIQCDSYPGPLGQVISNLVQNAVNHAFDGRTTGELRILAQRVGDEVEMQFVDNGVGMSAATLSRIFEPFFTTRLGKGGSGLGLSISRNLATGVLGGALKASSVEGEGSCFTLSFPATAPD